MNEPINLDVARERAQRGKLDKATRRSPQPGSELDQKLAFLPQTDLGNAERFVARNRDRFLWCSTVGWMAWDGKRWDADGAAEKVLRAEHDTVRAIQVEADAIRDTDLDVELVPKKDGKGEMLSDKLASWGRSSEAASKLSAIAKHATAYLTVKPSDFDADPMRINVLNGTLTIAKHPIEPYVTLMPHNPEDRITKIAPVTYDPNAACPTFDGFLLRVQPDINNRRFLDQWSGLSLTGDISEQKLVFHWGTGRNGKSVYVDAVGYVAGDYGATIPIETFIESGRARRGGEATPDLARLPGIRMLRTSEPEKGAKLAEALIKLATGGEPMDARHLNKAFFTFKPSFKLTIQGNYRPKVDGTDEGIWGRLNLVPWSVFIPKEERDRKLGEKLKAEASGILNRLLSGLCDWLDNGLVIPPDVEAATETYRADSDPIGRFLAVCTKPTIGHRTQATVLHELYVAWAKVNGEASRSANMLGRELRGRGMPDIKSGVQWWVDIETTKLPSEFVDNYGEPLHADENAYRRYRDGD
ncbi:DNA primase family protein [Methylobacterium goesingense]|uniref:DNA primase/helicase n=1 Tax=Methylobacterium goesingense TaxID=243690 RepID=A0ABV2LBV6_9HYPH|nr:phage/plasmid primase, P4 family [Methylobacterium goesingense]GJD73599.1 hypothetical protein CFIICLFH_1828 [Methylobacterium goesingense]